jgi:hypothetical protein
MSFRFRSRLAAASRFLPAALGGGFLVLAPACDVEPRRSAPPRFRLVYGSYLGSPADDQLREILLEADGSVWLAGQAGGAGFPTTPGVVQPTYAGEDTSRKAVTGGYGGDAWLGRLAPDGARFLAASYFGGAKQERNVYGLERAKNGDLVFTTMTRSPDLRTTKGAAQPRFGGGAADWYVGRLSPDLKTLRYGTFLGGDGTDFPRAGLALDAQERPIVVGYAGGGFPGTEGRERGGDDVVVARLAADGSRIEAAARVGGTGDDAVAGVAVDASGAVYFAGQTNSPDFPSAAKAPQGTLGGAFDATVVKLAPDLASLEAASFLGGAGNEFSEHRLFRAANGDVLVTGSTGSADFPATAGSFQTKFGGVNDGFLVRYSPGLDRVIFATYLGGSGDDNLLMPTPGPQGTIWCVGFTSDRKFPTTPDAHQPRFGGGKTDGIVVAFSEDGKKLVYASYCGGSGDDFLRALAFRPDGGLWLAGSTTSQDWRMTAGAPQTKPQGGADGFVLRFAAP